MAIISQEQQLQKQKKMLTIAAVILAFAGIVVYFTFLRTPAPAPAVSKQLVPKFEQAGKTTFNFAVFDGPIFKSLKSYVQLPITSDEKGRENPFLPY